MKVSKDRIVTLVRESGDADRAAAAERQLPDEIDLERDRGTLEDLGLDPKELLQKITGEGIPKLS
jgi:hypothetical protein